MIELTNYGDPGRTVVLASEVQAVVTDARRDATVLVLHGGNRLTVATDVRIIVFLLHLDDDTRARRPDENFTRWAICHSDRAYGVAANGTIQPRTGSAPRQQVIEPAHPVAVGRRQL